MAGICPKLLVEGYNLLEASLRWMLALLLTDPWKKIVVPKPRRVGRSTIAPPAILAIIMYLLGLFLSIQLPMKPLGFWVVSTRELQ